MSLYHKYRPLDFSALLGQDHVRDVLLLALKKNQTSHAYLFSGPRGTGKTSTARILARAMNCVSPTDHGPCNSCEICKAQIDERLTDAIEIDAASHGLVDDARTLVEQARFLPILARKKIYIIDEVHMLSKSAFNALLKIIEEPPDHVHFILATTEPQKVLETIRSRCQRFDFHLADENVIIEHLRDICQQEGVYPEENAIKILASHSRGSFRDALTMLEQVIGVGNFTAMDVRNTLGLSEDAAVSQFLDHLFSFREKEALQLIHEFYGQGFDLAQFCSMVLEKLREVLLSGNYTLDQSVLLFWIDLFFNALNQLKDPIIPELPLELAVIKGLQKAYEQKQNPEISRIQKTQPEKKAEPMPSSQFDKQRFFSMIDHAPLRSMVKYSDLLWQNNELKIIAHSSMEMEKMKQGENYTKLIDALKSIEGEKAFLNFELKKPKVITHEDISSVF